jgi:hypothetical protein
MTKISDKRIKKIKMPKSKHRKNHKQKAQARSNRIQQEKYRAQKAQKEFIEKIIELQKMNAQKTSEDFTFNLPTMPDGGIVTDGPMI